MMRKLFPAPLLSASLVAMWLVLNESLSAGHMALALLLGWLLPLLFAGLRPQRPRIRFRRALLIARFIMIVGYDVLVSNIQVAWGVLRLYKQSPRFEFVTIPLAIRDPHALAALAMVTTVIPGTVWCELAHDSSALILHVWDLDSEATFVHHYKSRYEAPLLEIFQS